VDAAHLVETCLRDNAEFIRREYLDSLKEKGKNSVCEIESCRICSMDIGVKIADLESGIVWNFGYEEAKTHHHIYTNIGDGDDVHIGRLYVSV